MQSQSIWIRQEVRERYKKRKKKYASSADLHKQNREENMKLKNLEQNKKAHLIIIAVSGALERNISHWNE